MAMSLSTGRCSARPNWSRDLEFALRTRTRNSIILLNSDNCPATGFVESTSSCRIMSTSRPELGSGAPHCVRKWKNRRRASGHRQATESERSVLPTYNFAYLTTDQARNDSARTLLRRLRISGYQGCPFSPSARLHDARMAGARADVQSPHAIIGPDDVSVSNSHQLRRDTTKTPFSITRLLARRSPSGGQPPTTAEADDHPRATAIPEKPTDGRAECCHYQVPHFPSCCVFLGDAARTETRTMAMRWQEYGLMQL